MSVGAAIDELVRCLAAGVDDLEALQAVQSAARSVSVALDDSDDAERDAAAERLAAALRPDRGGAQGAITLGVLVEHGSPPAVVRPLLDLLGEVLPAAARFVAAVGRGQALDAEAEAAHPNPFQVGNQSYDVSVLRAAADAEPQGSTAWLDLALWCLPAIAALTRDAELRRAQREATGLSEALCALRHEEGAGYLHLLLHLTLADEALLVLHPQLGRGVRLRATEICSVFQLHALLADVLVPLGLPGTAPSAQVSACWRGEGPPSVPTPTEGSYQLWQWTGLTADGSLPDGVEHREHWLWNEDAPTDIARFEGVRTILVSPPAVRRTWNTGRVFGALRSDLVVEEELEAAEVTAILDRMRAAAD